MDTHVMSPEVISSTGLNTGDRSDRPSLILSLPNEILSIVLADVAHTEKPDLIENLFYKREGTDKRNLALGFLRLSEVCTRFRALLLSMPALWADSVFRLPVEPGKLALTRSQSFPLSIYIEESYKRNPYSKSRNAPDLVREHLLSVAAENAMRMRVLSASRLEATHYKKLFANQLPFLETIIMSYLRDKPSRSLAVTDTVCIDAPVLQKALFEFSQDEGLVYFQLFGLKVTFKFPNLRHLDISLRGSERREVLHVGWIVNLLQNSPLINHLRLFMEDFLDPINWEAFFSGRSIQLAHLRSLELSGSHIANLSDFFTHLRVSWPPRSSVYFHHPIYEPEDGADGITDDMLRFATTFAPSLRRESFNGLMVQVDQFDDILSPTLNLCVFPAMGDPRRHPDQHLKGLSNYAELYLRSILHFDDPVHENVASIFAETVRQTTINQLIVEAPMRDMWRSIVRLIIVACPAVTQLVVRHTREEGLDEDDEFSDEDSDEASSHSGFPLVMQDGLFPALESMFFQPNHEIKNKELYFAFWEGLVAWLEWRVRTGLRVRRLHVIGHSCLPESDRDEEHAERERLLCAQTADLVDEFVDGRVRLSPARSDESSSLTGSD